MIEENSNANISKISPAGLTQFSDELINDGHELMNPYMLHYETVTLDLHPQSVLLQSIQQQEQQQNLQPHQHQLVVFETNGEPKETYHLTELSANSLQRSDYNSNQKNQDSIMAETNTSDNSNQSPEDTNGECDILPSEDPYTYLQGLNSDNLMQFSQQSAIQELIIKEHLDIKPNLNVLPTLEEHDIGGYKFHFKISNKSKSNVKWVYSETRNKLYLRMNEVINIDAVYTQKLPLQQLRVRVLMCFVKEVNEPVLRCQNHLSKDKESHPKKRQSLLRCENPTAEYCGTAEGNSINDRYSILVPLGFCNMPKDDRSIVHTIALKFTCQNSCIGRKETCLIFLLEGMNGEILSQRVLDVKICSCPKRDHEADERTATKRKSNDDIFPSQRKIKKEDETPAVLKKEDGITELNTAKTFDVQPTPSGTYRLVMELGSKEQVQKMVDYACSLEAYTTVAENDFHRHSRFRRFRNLKRLYDKTLKLT